MKFQLSFILLLLFLVLGCGSDNKINRGAPPPVIEDGVYIAVNMSEVAEYTYSLSVPPPESIPGSISFLVAVAKNGSYLSLVQSDITWTSTGANVGVLAPILNLTSARLTLDGVTTGTVYVKATYLEGTIDEMSATVTIHIVP